MIITIRGDIWVTFGRGWLYLCSVFVQHFSLKNVFAWFTHRNFFAERPTLAPLIPPLAVLCGTALVEKGREVALPTEAEVPKGYRK